MAVRVAERDLVDVAKMSATYFQKPENALKRAEEYIGVGQKSSALDALETVIKSKRHRQWSPILEDIVKKFLSLCTEAQQQRRAREGLVQYRQITQQATAGPESIRKVVANFVMEGEAKVREAEEKAGLGADAVANLQDLEAEETPETMLISVLTGDLSDTGRADRDNYVKWLRFLWESYRMCLEVLKNNAKLEELYAETAKKTFAFCERYKRKVEFRRLKDLLKGHLSNTQLNTTYGAPTQEASLRLRLEIRAAQLNAACNLELWQLAFESAEELYAVLMHPSNKKAQKSEMMLNYYDKISQVFWVSDNYLFHACAMQRIYNLTERQLLRKVNKGELSREDADKSLEMLASKVLLGALAVPPPPVKHIDGDLDPEKEKHQRMAALVGHQTVPQRKNIISDIMGKNMMSNVPKHLAELFTFVETEFDPLNMSKRVKPWLEAIQKQPELGKYLQALKHVVLLKLVQQLSQVYQTMRISDFAKLADFLSLHDCEKLIVQAVSFNQAAARLDHKNGTLHLGDKGFEGETRRSQLTNLAKGLQTSLDLLSQDKEERRRHKLQAFKQLAERLEDERKMMDYRRQQIEERKELQEKETFQKAQQDMQRKKQEEEERRISEEKRKEEDQKKRAEDKRRAEREEQDLEEKKRMKEQLDALKKEEKKKKGKATSDAVEVGGKELEAVDDDDLRNIDKDALIKAKKAQEEKLKREAEERMQLAVQKLDHLERARRENERPLHVKEYEKQKEQDKQRWEVESKQFMENHAKKHAEDVEAKKRMKRMQADAIKYEEMVIARRKTDFEREKAAYMQKAKADKERSRREREEKMRKQREEDERKEKEEEERRLKAEEERKRREEERAKMDAIAEKQREREREIEAKRAADGPPRGEDRPAGDRGGGRFGDRGGGGFGDRGGGGFGDRGGDRFGDRGGDRFGDRGGGGGGDRWGGGDRGDRPPMDRGGDRWGGGDRDRGDRPPMDRGGDRFGDRGGGDRWGGGDRDRGDRPPMDRGGDRGGFGDRGGDRFGDRGGGSRFGGGDRGDRPPMDRGGDRFGDRGGGDRGGDRWGGGGGGGGSNWRSERAEPSGERRGGGSGFGGDRDRPSGAGERPRLNLAPRSAPREERAAPKVDDDGFATVTKKR